MSDYITAPRTITMDAAATVAELRFDNWNSLKLSGNAPLTFSNVGGQGQINVYKGSHTIDTPIMLASSSSFGVAGGLKLTVSKPIRGSGALVKTGPGTVDLTAPNTYTGQTLAADGRLILGASLTKSSSVTAQGTARIELAAGGDKIIKTGALAITGAAATIDLADNRLITTSAVGAASGGVYSGVSGMIQRSYNFAAWNGAGLTSSAAALTGGLTTLGVGDAGDLLGLGETETATWSGETITGASTLVMYTYAGDANLDGVINGGDYGVIDNFVQVPGADGYANGDFNYDGVVDGGDYGVIDNNIQAQGPALPMSGAAGLSGVTAIPEPSAFGLTILGSAGLLRRRRRQVSFR
jgi:autotransporter-associated beta strand protein